jgi:hypothetical protein
MLGNVRRFREYPERAVSKRHQSQGWLRASLHYTGYKEMYRVILQSLSRESVVLRPFYRACDTLLPAVLKREPMRMGYVGRSSETE